MVNLYGRLATDKPAKLLRRVEGWLLARAENAELNLAAGRLAAAALEYDTAKKYLQEAIRLGQLPQAYGVLGEVFEASNDSGQALKLYRAGMQALARKTLSSENLLAAGDIQEEPVPAGVKEGELV